MQNEKIDPLGNDFLGAGNQDFFERSHLGIFKRWSSCDPAVANLRDITIDQDNFSPRFSSLKLAVDMNWLVFVGIEKDNQSKVLI